MKLSSLSEYQIVVEIWCLDTNEECEYTVRSPTFSGVNRNLPLPPNISADKKAVLDILHNHRLVARFSWPNHEIQSAESRANETIFTFSLKALATVIHQARLTSVDDGLLIYERPGGGVSTHLEWRVSESIAGKYKGPGETQNPLLTAPPGFSLEEHYYLERSCLAWLDTKLYGHLQPTKFLLRFFKKIAQESSTNQAKQLQLGLNKPMDV